MGLWIVYERLIIDLESICVKKDEEKLRELLGLYNSDYDPIHTSHDIFSTRRKIPAVKPLKSLKSS